MCWEIDYTFFAEQNKTPENRIKQEQRFDVIDKLLKEANEKTERANVEGALVQEVAPAK